MSQSKWGTTEMATDRRDCDYGCTMGTGRGLLRLRVQVCAWGVDVYIFMRYPVSNNKLNKWTVEYSSLY